jgi:isoleucyl-tRNA synthetase
MALTQRLVELGRAARSKEQIKTRQPLAKARISTESFALLERTGLLGELAGEVNVNAIEPFQSDGQLVEYEVKPNFRELGRRFGAETPKVAAAIREAADQAELARSLLTDGQARVEVDGASVDIARGEVVIAERPVEGWSVVNEHGETIALDVALTPELVRAGMAREAVRLVQEARKSAGLDVSDRITLTWAADGELAAALREHAELLGRETLAVDVVETAELAQAVVEDEDLGLTFSVQKAADRPAGD